MGILGILFLVLAIVGLFTFIYVIVKAAKGWGGVHVTSLVFIFISTLVFMYSAAGVVHRRVGWVRYFEKQKKLLVQQETELEKVKFGDLTSNASDTNALIPVMGELNRLTVDRGRVWPGSQFAGFNQQDGTFNLVLQPKSLLAGEPPQEGAKPAVDPNIELLPKDYVVFAFAEEADAEGKMLPTFYLGEFLVIESKGNTAKLKPTSSIMPNQLAVLNSGRATRWSIYELMPLDSHEAFAAVGSRPSEEELFGHVDPQATAAILRVDPTLADPNTPITPANAVQAARLQSYVQDGQKATDATPPESVWIKVEFTKQHTIDVDSQEQRIAAEGGFFDMSGRTMDSRLKRGKEFSSVTFEPGNQRVFGREPAEELIKQGVAKLIERYYVRPLVDYQYAFQENRQRLQSVLQDAEYLKREFAIVDRTRKTDQEQIALRQVEQEKLKKDFAQYQKEQAVITQEAERLTREIAEVTARIKKTFTELKASHESLISSQSTPAFPVAIARP